MYRLKITEIADDGAAHKAGVQVGDYLESYDGTDLPTADLLQKTVQKNPDGTHLLKVIRGNALLKLTCEGGRLGVVIEPENIDTALYDSIISGTNAEAVEQRMADDRKHHESLKNIKITTVNSIDGYLAETIDIVSAECAYGMNIFRDFFNSIRDVVGGRSGSVQKLLKDARITCLNELKREAVNLGADAIIGVKLDYSEFSGQGNGMLFLAATGTAVKLRPVSEPTC
jgi:uncharacterized protein YbjQ (UPF0145 family)